MQVKKSKLYGKAKSQFESSTYCNPSSTKGTVSRTAAVSWRNPSGSCSIVYIKNISLPDQYYGNTHLDL